MMQQRNTDIYIEELLHVNEISKNKLVDLNCASGFNTIYLGSGENNFSAIMLDTIEKRIGKVGTTVLKGSSETESSEQIVGRDINAFEWKDKNGVKDTGLLRKSIDQIYKELALKGNNPLFLSVGALDWKTTTTKGEVVDIKTPFLIFPIKLVRTSANSPVYIEFIFDDIYINPCLVLKLKQINEEIVTKFPTFNNQDVEDPIIIEKIFDLEKYLVGVSDYLNSQGRSDINSNTLFNFDKNVVAISQYSHDELCMYYDIRRNHEKIDNHPLVQRIFGDKPNAELPPIQNLPVKFIEPKDNAQERIIRRVVGGESLVVKGPPGTGKTLTIINMLASLLAEGKKVLLSSQKPTAMFEVYKKLPEQLRKFVMMLDCETESQAAKLNPVEIKKDLKQLLKDKEEYSSSSTMETRLLKAQTEKKQANEEIEKYYEFVFGELTKTFGLTYYELLDKICSVNEPPVLFESEENVIAQDVVTIVDGKIKVEKAGEYFDELKEICPFATNPFLPTKNRGASINYDNAADQNSTIIQKYKTLLANVQNAFSDSDIDYKRLSLALLGLVCLYDFTKEDIEIAINAKREDVDSLEFAFGMHQRALKLDSGDLVQTSPIESGLSASMLDLVDGNLTVKDFNSFVNNIEVIRLAEDATRTKLLENYCYEIIGLEQKINNEYYAIYDIFSRDTVDLENKFDQIKDKIFKYENKENPKVGLLDFKVKKIYKELSVCGYGDCVSFADFITAVGRYKTICSHKTSQDTLFSLICKLFQTKFDLPQLVALVRFVEKARENNVDLPKYIHNFELGVVNVKKINASFGVKETNTISQVKNALLKIETQKLLVEKLSKLCVADGDIVRKSGVIIASSSIARLYNGQTPELVNFILSIKKDQRVCDGVKEIAYLLDKFANENYSNYYTEKGENLTLDDLETLEKFGTHQTLVAVTSKYLDTIRSCKCLSLENFFKEFENGNRDKNGYTFEELFEKSVYYLALCYRLRSVPIEKRKLGEETTRRFNQHADSEKEVSDINVERIEKICFERLKRFKDSDFGFLQSERTNTTLRKVFKQNAKDIFSLKSCFIISPSSVSVLFGAKQFENFDVAIVDEASQLTPTAIIPILFRTRQVVLVGDEWQMPPIKHFVAKTERVQIDEFGEVEYLNPDMSVLSLALKNNAFGVEQFESHFRSNTESLIAFSQSKFYPYLKTFPAYRPKADGLGFEDLYTPQGRCDGGVNLEEAKVTYDKFKWLFYKYFDLDKGVLSQSIGVVAFGEKQIDAILSMIRRDKDLSKDMATALKNFGDIEEKLIFFKTIETVQGQEIDHMILSLTYGKNKDGKLVQSFGELNRGHDGSKLGMCIFNVSVTRAKSSVSVVHSVSYNEITNESVAYIGEYLKTVQEFSQNGLSQFVCDKVEDTSGFIRQVADFIINECGIESERVVVNYGATKGSIKIPVVILSKDLTQAECALWCETQLDKTYNYTDYNVKYYGILEQRGWKMMRVFINDWVVCQVEEKEKIKKYINENTKQGE